MTIPSRSPSAPPFLITDLTLALHRSASASFVAPPPPAFIAAAYASVRLFSAPAFASCAAPSLPCLATHPIAHAAAVAESASGA